MVINTHYSLSLVGGTTTRMRSDGLFVDNGTTYIHKDCYINKGTNITPLEIPSTS